MTSYGERLREIRARAQRRTGNLYDTWFTRRVSAYVTAALVPLEVSPNTVSALNVLVGAAACTLTAFGDRRASIAGALLVHLYAVLDSVDGELARFFRRPSLRGMFLENWSAYLMINAWPLAVAGWLSRHDVLGGCLDPHWPVWVAIAHAAFARNAMPVARRVVLEVMQKNRTMARAAAQAAHGGASAGGSGRSGLSRARTFVEESVLNYTNVWIVLSTLVVVGDARLVAFAFVLYMAGLFAKELLIVVMMVATPRIDREIAAAYGDDESAV